MIINLPWKDRKVISEVAKLYTEMAMHGEGYEDRIRQFWRISMYVKAGILYRNDLETITTAMESFYDLYIKTAAYKDPEGVYRGMEEVIPKLHALLEKKEQKQLGANS